MKTAITNRSNMPACTFGGLIDVDDPYLSPNGPYMETYGYAREILHQDSVSTCWRYHNKALEGRQEAVRLGDDLALVVSCYEQHDSVYFQWLGDGTITFQFAMVGGCIDEVPGQGSFDRREAACTILTAPDGQSLYRNIDQKKGDEWHSVAIIYRPGGLSSFLPMEVSQIPSDLHWIIAKQAPQFHWHQVPLTCEMARATRDLLENPHEGPMRFAYQSAKATELLCETFRTINRMTTEDFLSCGLPLKEFRKLDDARSILIRELDRPFTLSGVAKRVGMSRSSFAAGFKQAFGKTVADFALQQRMEQAWSLLQDRELPVGQIAERVGYADATSFGRAFKAYFGTTPKKLHRAY